MDKRRSHLISFFLALNCPGLGHVYCGQFKRWMSRFFLPSIMCILGSLFSYQILNIFWITFLLYFFAIVLAIGSLFDVLVIIRKSESYKLQWFNKWYVYFLYSIIGYFLLALSTTYIRENVVQAFKIPAASMRPTIYIGDHILVDKRAYRKQQPIRKDVVVFRFPKDESKDFIKRIIGVPGDTIEIKSKVVYLNGEKQEELYTNREKDEFSNKLVPGRDNFGPVTVPKNSYFVLGDNRDHSLDSRFWGYVPERNLKGKVTHVYFSINKKEVIHWDRIGQTIP